MEEYLQYTKILRLQMNDVEDQALKNSVEEHMYFLTTQTMEISLLVKLETAKRASETEASADTVGGRLMGSSGIGMVSWRVVGWQLRQSSMWERVFAVFCP